MDVAWAMGDWASANRVIAQIRHKRGEMCLACMTTKTALQNLADKRHLEKQTVGRAIIFRAVQNHQAFQGSLIEDVRSSLFRTQRNPVLAHIAGELATDDESCAVFERLLGRERAKRPLCCVRGA